VTTRILPSYARARSAEIKFPVAPPRFVEYGYYVSLFYGNLAPVLGISIGLLGAAMLAGLAGFCVMRLGAKAKRVYAPIALPVACAVSFVAVQVLVHGESILGGQLRAFVMWIFTLIVAQSLSLRKGFLHRFVVAVLVIGLSALPFLSFRTIGGVDRATLDTEVTIPLAHPNMLGHWFGFCCVYFGILGLETRRGDVRMASWLIAAGCLLVAGLSVSRGALLGVGLAGAVAFRRLLKRGFIPLLTLILLGGFLSLSGIFERSIESFEERGMEESGRGEVWPVAARRILESPLVGFGLSNIGTPIPGKQKARTPHNGFLAVGLAAGIIPLAFLIAYWWRAGRGAYRLQSRRADFAPFYFPLSTFVFVTTMLGNYAFFISWVVVTLAAPLAAGSPRPRRIFGRVRKREPTRRSSAAPEVRRHPARVVVDVPRKFS
jgi:hypothetical protein